METIYFDIEQKWKTRKIACWFDMQGCATHTLTHVWEYMCVCVPKPRVVHVVLPSSKSMVSCFGYWGRWWQGAEWWCVTFSFLGHWLFMVSLQISLHLFCPFFMAISFLPLPDAKRCFSFASLGLINWLALLNRSIWIHLYPSFSSGRGIERRGYIRFAFSVATKKAKNAL